MNSSPTTLILFGGTGDLASRKLLPALYELYKKESLPNNFSIVGFSRKDLSDNDYRNYVKENVSDVTEDFLNIISYCSGDIMRSESYEKLSSFLDEKDSGVCNNKLYYLAVPPNLYRDVFNELSKSGLTFPCKDGIGNDEWSRVLVEKPFGFNRDEAVELDKLLESLFDEDQVYRIDHYLGKEAIQNILAFRFSNSMFDPVWNKDHIDRVEIKIHESLTVSTRGSFYDSVGALRDMGQNHILQMLAFVAMENPYNLNQDEVRKSREDVLSSVNILKEDGDIKVWKGQYNEYTEVEGVDKDSKTETYFKMIAEISNDRWEGVSFIMESGKGLPEKIAEIKIYFKEDDHNHQNILTFKIQPEESIDLKIYSKKPGFNFNTEEQSMVFYYGLNKNIPDAYEKVLYDSIIGDQTFFNSTKEVMAEWDIIMPILDNWGNKELLKYEVGEIPSTE